MNIPPEIIAAFVALSGVVVALWRKFSKRADDCEKRHEKTTSDLKAVKEEVGELKGRVQIAEKISPKLDDIHMAIEQLKTKP